MKRTAAILLLVCLMLSLCGCGSIFEKEYVAETNYVPPLQAENDSPERYTVRNMTELKRALIGSMAATVTSTRSSVTSISSLSSK